MFTEKRIKLTKFLPSPNSCPLVALDRDIVAIEVRLIHVQPTYQGVSTSLQPKHSHVSFPVRRRCLMSVVGSPPPSGDPINQGWRTTIFYKWAINLAALRGYLGRWKIRFEEDVFFYIHIKGFFLVLLTSAFHFFFSFFLSLSSLCVFVSTSVSMLQSYVNIVEVIWRQRSRQDYKIVWWFKWNSFIF